MMHVAVCLFHLDHRTNENNHKYTKKIEINRRDNKQTR